MSKLESPYELVLDPAAYAGIELLEEDGMGIRPDWHRNCTQLLIEITIHFNRHRPDFFVGCFNLMYSPNVDYYGPDYFYIKDGVDRSRNRKCWAVWEENGRRPDVIVELISPTSEREDRTTRFTIYEQTLRTPEYFLYNPDGFVLEGYRLNGGHYEAIQANESGWLWSEQLGAWLGNWTGKFLMEPDTYLRLYTADCDLVLLGHEGEQRADEEKARAGREKARADAAEREVVRLRALLAAKNGADAQ